MYMSLYVSLYSMMECKVEILPDALVLPRPPLLLPFPPSLACSYEGMFEVARLPEATPLSAERAAKCRQIMNVSNFYDVIMM